MKPVLSITLQLLAALALLGSADLRAQTAKPEPVAASAGSASPNDFILPASYAGVLPCADCAGIAMTLTLRGDGLYRLRRTFLGKPGAAVNEVGRWTAETSSARLLLRSGKLQQLFQIEDAANLRQLDAKGHALSSNANHTLRRTAALDAISETLAWRGEVLVQANAATVTDCASDLRWPLDKAGDYPALERSVLRQRSAADVPLVLQFEGRLVAPAATAGATTEQMVVDKFIAAQPGVVCDSTLSGQGDGGDRVTTTLKDSYWKLVELGGAPVVMAPGQQREQRITLAGGSGSRLSGFGGCNALAGSYVQQGAALRFNPLASTRMACAPPLMDLETRMLKSLGATTGYRIEGQKLLLLSGQKVLARFEAVYLR